MTAKSPFHWREDATPTIFMTGKAFKGYAGGKTVSQVCTENVEAFEKKNKRSLGTVGGISDKADREAEARQYMRKAKKA